MADSDKGYDLVKYRVNKTEDALNEYNLIITVPREITHDFESQVILTHPVTGQKTVIPLFFANQEGRNNQYQYASYENEPSMGIF